MGISRRQFTRLAAGATVLPALSLPSVSLAQAVAPGEPVAPTAPERDAMANLAHAFMGKYDVPAFSLAIGFGGKILHEAALGWADREGQAAVAPANRFRIASVSKPITSVAIFSLIEQGRIKLTDKIFGPGAILAIDYGGPPYHPHIDEITVEHLLTHTCGGWSNAHNGPRGDDPMFINVEMNQAQLMAWTLRNRPLDNPPGVHFDYSNFGYCVLGRVIEKITRQPYAVHARDAVLKRCGIDDMAIAGNTLAQRQPGEVKYYGQGENPYGINITRMDSHGGWIARPADIVQFFMHVDGFAVPPNILRPQRSRR
jgi:CubicO group peptidase (beta-lactamase class C family)